MKQDEDTRRHIKRRQQLAKHLGLQQGTVYEKHRKKFEKSAGYVRDGNLRHYVAVGVKKRIHIKGRRGEDL